MVKKRDANKKENEKLMKVFGIEKIDLEYNKEGKIGHHQIPKIEKKRSSISFGTTCSCTIIGLSALLYFLIIGTVDMHNTPSALILLTIPFVGIIGFMLFLVINSRIKAHDLMRGIIRSYEGILKKKEHPDPIHFTLIFEDNFSVNVENREIYDAFQEGKRYLIFYINYHPDPIILSAEYKGGDEKEKNNNKESSKKGTN